MLDSEEAGDQELICRLERGRWSLVDEMNTAARQCNTDFHVQSDETHIMYQ